MRCKKLISDLVALAMLAVSFGGFAEQIEDDKSIGTVQFGENCSETVDELTGQSVIDEKFFEHREQLQSEDKSNEFDSELPEVALNLMAADSPEITTVKVGEYDISDSVSLYDEFDYSDPQYITDELLFGEWDADTQSWIPQNNKLVVRNELPYPEQNDKPLIDYSYNPELAKVEEAVKVCDGNYAKPKALLLQYYRNKFKNMNKDITISGTESQTAAANALAYNFVITDFTAVNLFDVTANKSFYEFNVTDQIASLVEGTGSKKFCFVLNALELDGKKASFYSRESDNKPYLKLNLTDGTSQTFYPEADVTIKGGDNKSKSFPSDTELYVQERANVKVENDNNSQRALVRFDFSSIPQGTRVLSATFGICGWTDKTDAPKKIFLGSSTNVSWEENSLTWSNANFTHNISFDTQAGMIPDVYTDNYYNMSKASSVLAARYLYDMDEIYAYHGIRFMIQYHRNIDTRKYTFNDFLTKGVNGIELANSFYSFIGSEYMTPQNFAVLLKSVYCNTEWILEGWNRDGAQLSSNHATYYNRGFAALITLFPEFYKANDELQDDPSYSGLFYGGRGGWIPSLQRRVLYKAKEVSFPDGAGKEVPGGYNMEAYANTVAILQFATEANMPDILPDEYYDMMAVAALYFMHGMAPGYRDWNVGNSYGYGSQFINRPVIKQIIDGLERLLKEETDTTSERYKKRKEQYDQLTYAYTAGEKGTMPEFDSVLYPMARKVVMRDGWDKNAVGATMGIANGGIHAHFDDLSIVIAAYGRYLLADPGKAGYVQNEPYKCWYNSTRAHNTIEINDISQRSSFWSNAEVVTGPSDEILVLPFRGSHGLVLANNVSADAVREPDNAEYKAILDEKNYTKNNLKKLYDFDDALAAEANSSVSPKHYQGRFLESEMNKTFDYVKGETYNNIGVVYKDDDNVLGGGTKEYTAPDNAHNRSMLFVKSASVPSFYIVTDYVAPVNGNAQENKYSQAWHFTNDANITMDASTKTVKTHYYDVNIAVVPVIGEEIETEANLVDGWYRNTSNLSAKYVTYVKKASQPTTFNTILLPMDTGKDYNVKTEPLKVDNLSEAEASAFNFSMRDVKTGKNVEGTYYNLHDEKAKDTRQVGEYITDARLLYMDKNDTYYTTAVLADGTYVKGKNGNYLIKSNQNITHLGVEWRGTGLYLSTSKTDYEGEEYVDLSQLTILNQRNTSAVYLNEERISSKTKDGYIYFGDEPIIEGGGIAPGPDKENTSPGKKPSEHSSGGNSSASGGLGKSNSSGSSESDVPNKSGEVNATFAKELEGHWGETEISALVRDGVINGVSDSSLGLEQLVTRAEFSAMLIRALGVETVPFADEFPDVTEDDWYADIVATAKYMEILVGDEIGNANPNGIITREQMAKVAVLTLEKLKNIKPQSNKNESFSDANQVSDWAKEYVQAAVSMGIMNGVGGGKFEPQSGVPREQAMVLVYRLREKLNQ